MKFHGCFEENLYDVEISYSHVKLKHSEFILWYFIEMGKQEL